MRQFTVKTLPILALALSAGLAFAIEPTPPIDPVPPTDPQPMPTEPVTDAKPSFDTLDSNRDGQIAKAEVPIENELTTLFAHFDHNKDLFLSRTEFDEYAEEDEEEAE